MRTGWIVAMTLLLPGAAEARQHGGQTGQRQSWEECTEASGGITVNMMNCNGAEIEYQDARLNRAYKRVMARLTPAQRRVLRASERKWLRERDDRCERKNERDGVGNEGTLAMVMFSTCIMSTITARADWLENYRP
jgi:uncharacterized protein YecT (DUF1311 family)